MNCKLKHERLLQVLSYNKESGIFTWLIDSAKNVKSGRRGGCKRKNGYRVISIDGEQYQEHRVAFFYINGRWPEKIIDHINGNPSDNRIQNLREVSSEINSQNQRRGQSNSKNSLLGVSPSANGRYRAFLKTKGKQLYLGTYDTPEIAHEKYVEVKRIYHEGGML